MIRKIRLADAKGRDGLVYLSSPSCMAGPGLHGLQGNTVRFERIIKSPMDRNEPALRRQYNDDDSLVRALIDADPEIDMEIAGRIAGPCDRVWVNPEGEPLYAATMLEIVYGPDGVEKEQRPPIDVEANMGEDMPLRWSARFFKPEELIRRFATTRKFQILHSDGLTFDFLLGMARMLEEKNAFVSIGAGPRGRDPLILERNGTPYRAFLEGHVKGDDYLLILHLSNLELKRSTS